LHQTFSPVIKKSLVGLTAGDIKDLIDPAGFSIAHAVKISNSIYKRRVDNISQIAGIPGRLKNKLFEVSFIGKLNPVASEHSADKTVKYLFRSESGKEFETVFIPDSRRNTVCVSTQSGCRMGCPFCVTSGYGFHGNLSSGEIISQILGIPDAEKVTHVVFMGMGEPMDNLEEVLRACEIVTAEWGLSLSPRNVTVSTVGITQGVVEFLRRSECNLTLSLHSPFRNERKDFIPAEKKYPAGAIIEFMKAFPLKKKRRLSVAYVMIDGFNDSNSHLEALKSLLRDSGIRVNLLPYHGTGGTDQHKSSSPEKMIQFKHNLVISGISASVRKSRGADISAACGLLATGLR